MEADASIKVADAPFYAKLVCLVALVGAVSAQYGGHGHGHAFSSQHISRHDGPAHVVGHGHHHDYYIFSNGDDAGQCVLIAYIVVVVMAVFYYVSGPVVSGDVLRGEGMAV
ncbi:putative cuticle protein [Operophtera brumata]|uniref:Putative cuticle protein n=1 Tax=Operophtera brumata TaxID=104452 RepID=A0A0L7KPZ2_OPEBR|nr:putative cuticle protein [Operophtera brumata]